MLQAASTEVVHTAQVQLQALQVRREMLSSQYQQALAERGHVSQERMNAQARGDTKMVQEFDATIDRLGTRVRQLEKSVADADRAVDEAMKALPADESVVMIPGAMAPPLPAEVFTSAPPPFELGQMLQAQRVQFQRMMAAEAVGFALVAALLWRFGFARGKRAAQSPDALKAAQQGDDRMQQAIDAIAIEVERLSEGQRFVNNLLTTRRPERETLPKASRKGNTPSDGSHITPH